MNRVGRVNITMIMTITMIVMIWFIQVVLISLLYWLLVIPLFQKEKTQDW